MHIYFQRLSIQRVDIHHLNKIYHRLRKFSNPESITLSNVSKPPSMNAMHYMDEFKSWRLRKGPLQILETNAYMNSRLNRNLLLTAEAFPLQTRFMRELQTTTGTPNRRINEK